ncbi:MAG: hypothetical protein ACM3UL_01895 [Ignavibacteria bacterium]
MTQELIGLTALCELGEKEALTITFEAALMEAIDEVFQSLGEDVEQSIYRYLENNYGIKKVQIPVMIDDFTGAVESIFGVAGKLVELKIMKRLQSKVQGFAYKPKNKEVLFTDYLISLRKYLDLQEKS